MGKPIQMQVNGKKIALYKSEADGAPIVYANMFMEAGREVLSECVKLGSMPFHFASITGMRWDEELSPWAHGPVVDKSDHFTGEADSYVRCMTEEILPLVEEGIKNPPYRVLAGYSMGGLFALYAPYLTDAFSRIASASGSVWYPDFVAFAREHGFPRNPDAIYLSLGDLESRVANPHLRRTEQCMRELLSIYQEKAIPSTFELNPGNHYKDAALRLAKGIAWCLSQ